MKPISYSRYIEELREKRTQWSKEIDLIEKRLWYLDQIIAGYVQVDKYFEELNKTYPEDTE